MGSDILENNGKLKENPFLVPEGYFRTMPQRALLSGRRHRIAVRAQVLAVAAAAVILIAGIWTWSVSGKFISSPGQSAVQMSDEEIIAYLIYSGVEVDEIVLQSED